MSADWSSLKQQRAVKHPLGSDPRPSTSASASHNAAAKSKSNDASTSASAIPAEYSHPDLPASLQVHSLEGRGRGIVARQAFTPGQTLLTTAPLVSVLDNLTLSARCSYCFRAADDVGVPAQKQKLLQCSLCHIVQYCSPTCQKHDWTVHKRECQALRDAARASGKKRSVPDTPVRALARLLWTRELKGDEWWDQIEYLESHRASLSSEEQERFFHLSVALAQYVGQETVRKACPDAKAVIDLCSRFAANSFALTAPTDLSNIGVSVSPLTALFNHSCSPNAVIVFPTFPSSTSPRHMHVVAIRNIAPEEEVLTSYVDLALPRDLRRKDLRERYKFECACPACDSRDVDARETLLCPRSTEGCEGLIPLPDPVSLVTSVACPICKTTAPYKNVHAALDAAKLAFADAERKQHKEPHVAALHLQHLLASLTAPLDSTPAFALSAYPVLPALQLLLTLQLHEHAFVGAQSTAALAWAGAQRIYARGHPVRALLRTTLVRLQTMPPAPDAAHPEAEQAYWSDVDAREQAVRDLVSALEEVEITFGEGEKGFGNRKGGEMARMLRDLISDQEQGIVVGRRMRAASQEVQREQRRIESG